MDSLPNSTTRKMIVSPFRILLVVACLAPFASGFARMGRWHPPPLQRRPTVKTTRTTKVVVPPQLQRQQQRPTTLVLHALPVVPPHVWSSFLPPFLGFYKSEYTVSLGYGFSVALTALALWRQFSGTTLMSLHASALVFYGFRLNIFLVIRNLLSTRIQEFNTRVEERALARGSRAKRAPFILSCGMLYYGLAIPLWFTGNLLSTGSSIPAWATTAFQVLIGSQWLGFGVAALGDLTKTYVKQSEKNEKFLVTSGIFSLVRHPNYSGEILGWTANAWMGLLAATLWIGNAGGRPSIAAISNLVLLALGWVGILFVLLRATSNLEARQKTEYGDQAKYKEWMDKSWGGWQLPTEKAVEQENNLPQIELDESSEEESGSGI